MSDIDPELDNSQPVELTTNADQTTPELKHLFSIDGTPYYIDARPRPNIGLKQLWLLKTKGEEIAQTETLIAMIGEEGFQALMNYDGLKAEELEQIFKIANDTAFGTLAAITGKSGKD